MAKKIATTNGLEILHRRHYAGQPARLATLNQARANDSVARQLVALRTEASLTQRELAALIGTTASVICRLEDADYEGHSLTMLSRIAAALQQRVEISFVPLGKQRQAA
jgi:DNA-binding XRE family transcriptional regulator